ncbi:MAG: hypothetical protein M1832_002698 [Thelocarpon impressellum]|nr:MAG: hypothetical protein M1832_002698 [Thelocarpon impressellum]
MDRIRSVFRRRPAQVTYEPLEGGSERADGEPIDEEDEEPFSWVEYSIFLLLGVAMLWAWNMFMAAAPYFQRRFRSSEWILKHFQSAILSVSTVANLGSMFLLTKAQSHASYPKRIISSLFLNMAVFTLLAMSTSLFRDVTAGGYLGFLLTMVFAASVAAGLSQNGTFAYVSGFGRAEYTQAIMTGQGVAGVLPCIAQIVSVLSVPRARSDGEERRPAAQKSSTSALSYFLTATAMSAISLVAFLHLVPRHRSRSAAKRMSESMTSADDGPHNRERRVVGMLTLLSKLRWQASAVFLCFSVTMLFPVFSQAILSVQPPGSSSRLFEPDSFIPLALLFWNAGDLLGRLSTGIPALSFPSTSPPQLLLLAALLRTLFIPLYLACNIPSQQPPLIASDLFYLVVVQFGFGLTNGWLGSSCMIAAPRAVEEDEREAAGGFMGLCLVAGLTAGSLASFGAAAWI